jgi:hypothetical protein
VVFWPYALVAGRHRFPDETPALLINPVLLLDNISLMERQSRAHPTTPTVCCCCCCSGVPDLLVDNIITDGTPNSGSHDNSTLLLLLLLLLLQTTHRLCP